MLPKTFLFYYDLYKPFLQITFSHLCLPALDTYQGLRRKFWCVYPILSFNMIQILLVKVFLYSRLVITSLPLWDTDVKSVPPVSPWKVAPNQGILEDSSAYLFYRLPLYVDGFKQVISLSDTLLVDGFYLLPLDLTHSIRSSSSSARIILSFLMHNVPMTYCMHFLITFPSEQLKLCHAYSQMELMFVFFGHRGILWLLSRRFCSVRC